ITPLLFVSDMEMLQDTAERPKLKPYWQTPTVPSVASTVRKLHETILAKASDQAVADARVELTELEVLTRVRLGHDSLLRRPSSPTEPVANILGTLHTFVANLVQINKFEEAWQLLIDASQAIPEFGLVVDGILPRLVALLPYLLCNPPIDRS